MAPTRPRENSIEPSPEYDKFISVLTNFHYARGTNFEPQPRVGSRRVDLLRLYERVTSEGGYDAVSDTKSQKLAWRKIGQEFNLGTSNLPALAFNLKTAYYKNLAAFEIMQLHGRVPPPKEILEDVSAKGGDLLNRTVENYQRHLSRDEQLGLGRDDDGSELEGQDTPKDESMDVDELAYSGGRSTRGLRHAPPQRVLYQPDMTSARQTRHSSGVFNSPTPMSSAAYGVTNGQYNLNGLSPALANYEPRPQHPLSLKPVATLANNPDLFKSQQSSVRDARFAGPKPYQPSKGLMLPGTGFPGPNIYNRALSSLQSGILEEQEYALHHLVRISFERGDKYRFEGFPSLADSLIEKVLEISSLFADVKWDVVYFEDESLSKADTLDGLNGTIDVLNRIRAAQPFNGKDQMESVDFARQLALINEAALVLRNMAMMDLNAEYLSGIPTMRDALVIVLNLPSNPATIELKHYCLEIAEQLTKYYSLPSDDPLHVGLLTSIDSSDRGAILASLRAISRLSLKLEHNVRLQDVPVRIIQRLCEWILVEDEELRNACLDFLYQYTAAVDNVETLLKTTDVEALVRQLVRLLLYNAQYEERKERVKKPVKVPVSEDIQIPRVSQDLVQDLLVYDEPERSSQWLHACFEEDITGEITQIALWQAYQLPFSPFAAQRPLLPAKDFITNVSNTFAGASAQVLPGNPPKFVIKGIKPRKVPVDRQGRIYMRCLWHISDDGTECGEFALRPKDMWQHIIMVHLKMHKTTNGKFDVNPSESPLTFPVSCRWAGCHKYTVGHETTPYAVGMHVKTHLPDVSDRSSKRSKYNRTPDSETLPNGDGRSWPIMNTQTDERNDAAGLPLTSALVLRNLARNIPKVEADAEMDTETGNGLTDESLVWKIFAPVKEQLYFVMAYNQSLRDYLPALTRLIDRNGG